MTTHHDVVVIGGGQAGLSISWHLAHRSIDHVVLERDSLAHEWRDSRWDNFTLVTPNWQCALPGYSYAGGDPDVHDAGADLRLRPRLRRHLPGARPRGCDGHLVAPVRRWRIRRRHHAGTSARRPGGGRDRRLPHPGDSPVRRAPAGIDRADPLLAVPVRRSPSGRGGARRRQRPVGGADRRRPHALGTDRAPGHRWRAPGRPLLPGPRLCRLATRHAPTTCRSPTTRWPRQAGEHQPLRHRPGRWPRHRPARLRPAGHESVRAAARGRRRHPAVRADARVVARRRRRCRGEHQGFHRRLHRACRDRCSHRARYVPVWRPEREATSLDLASSGITSVVWSIGFRTDYRWLHAGVFDGEGHPCHNRGVTAVPGLFFLGLPWQHTWVPGGLPGWPATPSTWPNESSAKCMCVRPYRH